MAERRSPSQTLQEKMKRRTFIRGAGAALICWADGGPAKAQRGRRLAGFQVTGARANETVAKLLKRNNLTATVAGPRSEKWPDFLLRITDLRGNYAECLLWVAPPNDPDQRAPAGYPSLVLYILTKVRGRWVSSMPLNTASLLATKLPAGAIIQIVTVGSNPNLG